MSATPTANPSLVHTSITAPAASNGSRPPTPVPAIARLPVEILALVFEDVWHYTAPLPRLDIESWPWYGAVDPSVVRISHVSRAWREIALNLPLLWSRVDDRMAARMLTFIDRSRTAPLFLSICLSIFHSGIPHGTIYSLLHVSAHRLHRLDVRLEALDIFSHPRLDFLAPNLQVLTIECEIYGRVEIVNHPVLFRGETPALKALALLHVRHWLPGNSFPSLAHLNISYFYMEELPIALLAHLLANCPRLESLHLGQIWSYPLLALDLTPPASPVPLPHLRSLSTSCATLQFVAALLAALTLFAPIRIRVHAAPVQSHTNIWDNFLPSLRFMGALAHLEIAADSSRLYLLAEGERSALWIQAEFQDNRSSLWLSGLANTLDLAAVHTLHVACADWSLLPIFLRHMPTLAVLGVMALPQDAMRRDLFQELERALLAVADSSFHCPALSTLSIQSFGMAEHVRRIAALAAQRAAAGARIARLVLDTEHLTPAQPPSPLDGFIWEHVRRELAAAQTAAHVDVLEVGAGGVCRWAEPRGWDAPSPYWRLPAGDEPRCAFPWPSA